MKKQGVLKIELCGREISELRNLVHKAATNIKPPHDRNAKMLLTYYNRIMFKLNGSYQCKYCRQWITKGE